MSGAPVWVTLVAGLGSGAAGSGMGFWQARKLTPSLKRQVEADTDQKRTDTVHTALQTVEEALNIARGRIDNLQQQVTTLTTSIGDQREQLRQAKEDRAHIEEALNIALAERAKLQQQIMDLNRRVGARRVADLELTPPDAIVMVDLETGKIAYASEGVYPLLGYTPSRLVGEELEFLVPDAERMRHRSQRTEFAHKPMQRGMGSGLPLFVRPNGGGRIPVDISLHPTGDGRVIALIKRRVEVEPPGSGGTPGAATESTERSLVH